MKNISEKFLNNLIDYIEKYYLTEELYERSIALNFNHFEFNFSEKFYMESGIYSVSFDVIDKIKSSHGMFPLSNFKNKELDNLTLYGNIDMLNTFSGLLRTGWFSICVELVILSCESYLNRGWDSFKISWVELLDFDCFDYFQVVDFLDKKGVFNHLVKNFSVLNSLLTDVIEDDVNKIKYKFDSLSLVLYTSSILDLPLEKLFNCYDNVYLIINNSLEHLLYCFNIYYKDYCRDDMGNLVKSEFKLNTKYLNKFITFLNNTGIRLKYHESALNRYIPYELVDLLGSFIVE